MSSFSPAPAAAAFAPPMPLEVLAERAFAPPVPLEVLAERAFVLQPDRVLGRRDVLRAEAAMSVDRLLARVARGRGALDVALAEGLAALSVGDRFLRLGYSGGADYAWVRKRQDEAGQYGVGLRGRQMRAQAQVWARSLVPQMRARAQLRA